MFFIVEAGAVTWGIGDGIIAGIRFDDSNGTTDDRLLPLDATEGVTTTPTGSAWALDTGVDIAEEEEAVFGVIGLDEEEGVVVVMITGGGFEEVK